MNEQNLSDRVFAGIKIAIKETIEEHEREGRPYVIMKDGEVIWVETNLKK